MELQLALLIAGFALVALVVIASLFPAVGTGLKSVFNKKPKASTAQRASRARQEATAPRLESSDAAMLSEAQLLDEVAAVYDAPLVNDASSDELNIETGTGAAEAAVFEGVDQLAQEAPAASEAASFKQPTYTADSSHNEPFEVPQQPAVGQLNPLFWSADESKGDAPSEQAKPSVDAPPEAENQGVSLSNLAVQLTPTETYTSLKQIDYWVKFICHADYNKPLIMQQLGSAWNEMALNEQIHGLNRQDLRWHDFNHLPADATFKEFVISFQLLNNGQAYTANTLRRFTNEVDKMAKNLRATTQYLSSAPEAAIQSANLASLYAHCQGNIEVQIHAPLEQPFYGKVIGASAKMQGLEFQAGQYVRKKQLATKQINLYRLAAVDGSDFYEQRSDESTIKAVKFIMQPATSKHPGRVVKEMLDSAKAYASRVTGELQVFKGVEFHQDQLRQVRDHVSTIESKMTQAGLPAGSEEAVRLFS